jgi:hypothetical protein
MDGGDYESGDDGQTEALTGVDVAQSGATLRRETATNGVGILPGGEHRPRFSIPHLPAPNHHVAVTKAVAGRSRDLVVLPPVLRGCSAPADD